MVNQLFLRSNSRNLASQSKDRLLPQSQACPACPACPDLVGNPVGVTTHLPAPPSSGSLAARILAAAIQGVPHV